MSVGAAIGELVGKSKLTKRYISEKIGISRVTLDEWIKDNSYPTSDKLEMLGRLFNVSPAFFFDKDISRVNLSEIRAKKKPKVVIMIELDDEQEAQVLKTVMGRSSFESYL